MMDISNLEQHKKVAFFLNVYQCMYVHNFLKKVFEEGNKEEEGQNQGLLGQITNYVLAYSPKSFYYNIGGFNINLEEIKHGLLRNNEKSPKNYMRSLNAKDERLELLNDFFDPRIVLICLDYPECLELIDSFEGSSEEKLDEELEDFVSNFIEA